jgi:glycosyltransferase involved in cell wall biosynthesis
MASKFGSFMPIAKLVRRIDPDVFHAYGDISMGYLVSASKAFTRKPSIVTIARNWTGYAAASFSYPLLSLGKGHHLYAKGIFPTLKRSVLSVLDHIVCCNGFVRDQIFGNNGFYEKVSVIHPGVREDFLQHVSSVRRAIDDDDNKDRVLFWGDGSYLRGFYVFLSSIDITLRKCPQARFVAAVRGIERSGDNAWQRAYHNILNDPKRLQMIHSELGAPSVSISSIVASSDVVALPSLTNPMEPPLTVIESMSLGKAVVTTNIGGNSEIIDNMKNGILIEPDSAQLSEAIIALLRDEHMRKELGARAKETIRTNYNWDECVRKMMAIYESVSS